MTRQQRGTYQARHCDGHSEAYGIDPRSSSARAFARACADCVFAQMMFGLLALYVYSVPAYVGWPIVGYGVIAIVCVATFVNAVESGRIWLVLRQQTMRAAPVARYWRLLSLGEVVQRGDEIRRDDIWLAVEDAGDLVGSCAPGTPHIRRRCTSAGVGPENPFEPPGVA